MYISSGIKAELSFLNMVLPCQKNKNNKSMLLIYRMQTGMPESFIYRMYVYK
jgi:hypothetical protein